MSENYKCWACKKIIKNDEIFYYKIAYGYSLIYCELCFKKRKENDERIKYNAIESFNPKPIDIIKRRVFNE